ncbi:hypothetical protein D3C86_2004100 [compost metagenome]
MVLLVGSWVTVVGVAGRDSGMIDSQSSVVDGVEGSNSEIRSGVLDDSTCLLILRGHFRKLKSAPLRIASACSQ